MVIRSMFLVLVLLFSPKVKAEAPSDEFCAALTAFTEARGEGRHGIALVVHTVMNRAANYNKTLCQVAYAAGQYHGVLFWPKNLHPSDRNPKAWQTTLDVTRQVMAGDWDFGACTGAEFFYTPKVYTPTWSRKLPFKCAYKGHRFHGPRR